MEPSIVMTAAPQHEQNMERYLEKAIAALGGPNPTADPTGVKFIDDFTDGLTSGEIYSCLGPTGSCKTSMAVQLAVTYSLKLWNTWVKNERKTPLGKVFYVTTDDGLKAIQSRMLSFGAVVNRNQISGKSTTPLTTKETMSDADRALASDPRFGTAICEADRVNMMKQRFKDNLRVIDMRDQSVGTKAMYPITSIRQQISNTLHADGDSYCALIVIDHCETLISRLADLREKGISRSEIIEQLPLEIKEQLAAHFDCPVWVVHQISGEANKKSVNARITHADGKGSVSWGNDFHSCFSVSKINRKTSLCRLSITRNCGGPLLPDITLKLIGELGTLVES